MKTTERLVSIDTLRGFDMLWIMGGGELLSSIVKHSNISFLQPVAEQMEHVPWNGFHFYDIIFPLFLFIAGVTIPFSVLRHKERGDNIKSIHKHILVRVLILIGLGIVYNGFFSFDWPARYASVLARIGIAWAITALLALHTPKKWQYIIFGSILLVYWAILTLMPVPEIGAGIITPETSIVGYIDRLLLPGNLYFGCYDPEGILSTLPAIATGLLGCFCGYHLQRNIDGNKKALQLVVAAFVTLFAGWLWSFALPINKNIWTSSFVLFAGGWSMLMLAMFYWIIDVKNFKKWTFPFVVIGMNSITIYMAQSILGLGVTRDFFFTGIGKYIPAAFGDIYFNATYVLTCWFFLYFLYKKKIFLKV